MSKKIEIIYSYATDETKLKTSKDFESLPIIHQCDAIQDGLAMIQDLYNRKYAELIGYISGDKYDVINGKIIPKQQEEENE